MLSRKHWILPFVSDFASPYLRPICCCLPPPCFSMTTAVCVRNCRFCANSWEAQGKRPVIRYLVYVRCVPLRAHFRREIRCSDPSSWNFHSGIRTQLHCVSVTKQIFVAGNYSYIKFTKSLSVSEFLSLDSEEEQYIKNRLLLSGTNIKDSMSDDILHRIRNANQDPNLEFSPEIYNETLKKIDGAGIPISNMPLIHFGMASPNRPVTDINNSDVQLREQQFDALF
ncbi:uncharacterized protein CEXT_598911 [Caerostris extrusa]|uniref:Uncharacterized protein n=1 Tax=Caerostris extrusa TaxID=172846 RepID=A0AAV4MYI4_CAEEX|nr:uncharacterized protein CEXT_598911 [Caerostris extrusa]